jgi:hypothetical protein
MTTDIKFQSYLAHFFLEWKILQTKYAEKLETQVLCSITPPPFFLENRAVYKISWKNTVECGRPQMIIWRMRIACWVTKTTNTHTQNI